MKQTYPYIHSLRFFATLAIILLHTSSAIYGNIENYSGVSDSDMFVFAFYKHIMEWAVPVFVMITGALLLSPEKQTDYRIILDKYVKRMALAILVFGLPMALSESFLTYGFGSFIKVLTSGIVNCITGFSWNHMWYLYMLICLYMITPIIKPFVNSASKGQFQIALFVMFLLSSLIPVIKSCGVDINGYMVIGTPFIFLYMLGYYLHVYVGCDKEGFVKKISWVLLLLSVAAVFLKVLYGIKFNEYADVPCIVMAVSLFLIFKCYGLKSDFFAKMAPCCFAVYLIHPLFINLFYKILDITPLGMLQPLPLVVKISLFFILFSLLSFALGFILLKIKPLKKYIL